jgi:hypothetical protein
MWQLVENFRTKKPSVKVKILNFINYLAIYFQNGKGTMVIAYPPTN